MCKAKMDCYLDCESVQDHNEKLDQLPLWTDEEWAELFKTFRENGD
jgi:hypothetical protein